MDNDITYYYRFIFQNGTARFGREVCKTTP